MGRRESGSKPNSKKKLGVRFPIIVFLLLLGTIYFFWIYPLQKGRPPVKVTFEPAQSSSK